MSRLFGEYQVSLPAPEFWREFRSRGSIGVAQIVLAAPVRVQGNAQPAGLLQQREQPLVHFPDNRLVRLAEDQVVGLDRVLLQVVQFVDVPDAVVVDILVPVCSQCVNRGRLREVAFPVIFILQFRPSG